VEVFLFGLVAGVALLARPTSPFAIRPLRPVLARAGKRGVRMEAAAAPAQEGKVRVRFAPSPTGFFHIGSARTALFNWLYARHTGGEMVLRIEDTDKARNTEEALRVLLDGMRWLGLDWDEGPEKGGDAGPYFQSQRDEIYAKYLEKLREKSAVYDKDGAVWLKISGEPQNIDDMVRGRVVRAEEKDFVIFRSDGSPVFHFVNVVDDIEMGITHVIRGEDHLSNTSKHVELYKAFGVPVPVFAHIPLILKSEGSGKMSKRDVGALIEDYADKEYMPEAVRNYLCLLGWSPKDDREIMDISEIIDLFDLSDVTKSNARFDEQKMAYFNTEHLRQMNFESFCSLARPVLAEASILPEDVTDEYINSVLRICQEKVREMDDLPNLVGYFFKEDFEIDEESSKKVLAKGDPAQRVHEFNAGLTAVSDFSEDSLGSFVKALAKENGVKPGAYIQAVRLAVSGQAVGPGFYPMLVVLGKDRVQKRLASWMMGGKTELSELSGV
jgi:glutamyl-tRNA synthetase